MEPKAFLTAAFAAIAVACTNAPETNDKDMEGIANDTRVFAIDPAIKASDVRFHNHFGIELAGHLYLPAGSDSTEKYAAIAVSGPFGAVKEQSSGLYAQELAKRGFVAVAFDPSYTGESGGEPRDMFSLDINTEDFQASVDYLGNLPYVDAGKVGILGICGWGGIALNAAANDPRIKATVASTMYDMPRVGAWGYNDSGTADDRYKSKKAIAELRTREYVDGIQAKTGGNLPYEETVKQGLPLFLQEYSAYYMTPRGYHERAVNSNGGWPLQTQTGWMNNGILSHPEDLRNPVLMVHGEMAHSRYFSEDTFKKLIGDNKELWIVPGANHTDLYDGGKGNHIPFDKIEDFYRKNL